ncbi:MAG: DUF262 domain-containing protein [Thermoguttaceae bacterium]|nr:DUF262 domain-containing protein [Thermoguttaceae bacterium]
MKADCKNLSELLSNKDRIFYIPPYQRNYEWTEEQCEVFFNDIVKTSKSNKDGVHCEHFFGAITFFIQETDYFDPDTLVLIDGQQRITTTMLFLTAMRNLFQDDKSIKTIESKYLLNSNTQGDSSFKVKLKQVATDWEDYKSLILNEDVDLTHTSRVIQNYRYFLQKLTDYEEDGGSLQDLLTYGFLNFSIVTIRLYPLSNPWENPQEIFESMNSLGKPLSFADLVRNYLLLKFDDATQEKYYNKYWLKIERCIPGQVSNFIRDYMQAQMQKSFKQAKEANYKALYRDFKHIYPCESATDVERLLSSLTVSARIYSYIVNNETTGNKQIDDILTDLRYLGITTAYSFLLALLTSRQNRDFSDQDIIDILNVFRIYCMRRRILAITSAENKNFPLLVRRLEDLKHSNNKREEMFKILASQEHSLRIPNDTEIRQALLRLNFYNFAHCEFYLSLIEESLTKSRPFLSDKTLQVEHIMPKTLNSQWYKSLGSGLSRVEIDHKHQEFLNTIGNLTLIRHNQELGNKPFIEKKQVYENNAGLQIARTLITNQTTWDFDTIQTRTNWMIDYLLDNILTIPDSMREKNNYVSKKRGKLSFNRLGLINKKIHLIKDPSIYAIVVSDKDVEFEGKKWKLSSLTKELMKRRNELSPSGSYDGIMYWEYNGVKLSNLKEKKPRKKSE